MTRQQLQTEFLKKIAERKSLFKMKTTNSPTIDALISNLNTPIKLGDIVAHVNFKNSYGKVTNIKNKIISVNWKNIDSYREWHESFLIKL